MRIRTGSRQDLLRALGRSDQLGLGALPALRVLPDIIPSDSLLFIWEDDPHSGSLPDAIVVASDPEDFLAWCNTYLPSYSPFTSLFRVLDLDLMHRMASWQSSASHIQSSAACVSLCIAEAAVGQWQRGGADVPTLTGCMAGISAALTQSLHRGVDSAALRSVARRWRELRRAVDHKSDARVAAVCEQILGLLSMLAPQGERTVDSSPLASLGRFILAGSKVPESLLDDLRRSPLPRSVYASLHDGDRESRVAAFDVIAATTIDARISEEAKFAVIGYCASRIAPGTITHLRLIREAGEWMWPAALWFAFAAASCPETDVWNWGGILARRLKRELSCPRMLLAHSGADVSFEELQVLLRSQPSLESTVRSHVNEVWVELLPGVVVASRLPGRQDLVPSYQQSQLALPGFDRGSGSTGKGTPERVLKEIERLILEHRTEMVLPPKVPPRTKRSKRVR